MNWMTECERSCCCYQLCYHPTLKHENFSPCVSCQLQIELKHFCCCSVVVNPLLICKSRQWWSNTNHNPFHSLISHLKCFPKHILVCCLAAVWYCLLPAGCHIVSYFNKSKPSAAQLAIRHPSAGMFFHPVLNYNCRQLKQCFICF